MPDTFEFHCFGGRFGERSVGALLGAMGLRPTVADEPGQLDVLDCGDGGVWVRGSGSAVGGLAPRIAAEVGRAMRHYRVRARKVDEGVLVEVDGATWWPDGRRVTIRGVEDRFEEDPSADLVNVATQALSVTVEVREQLHHDDASVERWVADVRQATPSVANEGPTG